MKKISRFIMVFTLCVITMFGMALAADPIEIDLANGSLTINESTYVHNGSTVSYTEGTEFIITGSNINPVYVTVSAGVDANVTLNGASIVNGYGFAFQIADNSTGNVNITIADNTVNTVSGGRYAPGICKSVTDTSIDVGTLTINGGSKGNGVLNVSGGAHSAGIGGMYSSGGTANIVINGGIINAVGSSGAAGIGGGGISSGSVSNIVINGGTVTATGNGGGAGIGSGNCNSGTGVVSDITINGGVVIATGSEDANGIGAAGIGGGVNYSASYITINGGIVSAYGAGDASDIGGGEGMTTKNIVIKGGSVLATMGTTPTNGALTVYSTPIFNPNSLPVIINGKLWNAINHLPADADDYYLRAWLPRPYEYSLGIKDNNVSIDISMGSLLIYEDYYQFGDTIVEHSSSNPNDFEFIITGTTTENNIQVMNNNVYANITLAGTTIDLSAATGDDAKSPIHNYSNNMGDMVITLKEGTTNTLKASEGCAGIRKAGRSEEAGSLTIQGTGSLSVFGGANGSGIGDTNASNSSTSKIYITGGTIDVHGGTALKTAPGYGIGANTVNDIVISGGKVSAYPGYGNIGIGGATVDGITISGGVVDAHGASTTGGSSQAIGGASIANIKITGGTVSATPGSWKGNPSVGIGGTFNSNSEVAGVVITGGSIASPSITNPTNGSVAVSKLTIANPNSKAVKINGKNWTPVNHTALDASDTNLYAWVPAGSTYVVGTAPKVTGITDGETYYVTQKITVTDDDPKSVVIGGVNYNQTTSPQSFDVTGNVDKTYTITVTDESGNVVEYTIEMLPISTIAIPIEDLTVDNVTEDDRDTILDVLATAEEIDLTDATDNEKAEVQAIIDKCKELLAALDKTTATFEIRHSLNLLDLVQIGYWFTATPDKDGVEFVDYGLLIWDEESYLAETDFTVNSETAYQPEVSFRSGYQMGFGEGVYAQYLDTKYYAIPYAVTADGEYVYAKTPDVYAIPMYALETGFINSTDTYLKTVVYDLLNYATYAQYYFYERNTDIDVNTLTPINSVLSVRNQTSRFDESMLVSAHTASKNTANNLDCTWLYTTANLESAIALNFFAEQSDEFTGMIYWTAADYSAASSLIYATRTDKVSVTDRSLYGTQTTTGQIDGIYAKDLASPIYASMYNLTSGKYTYGTVRVDSVAAYITRGINATDENASDENYYFEEMCKRMLAYGDSAKTYAETR